ncbi:hypothetical protein H5410_004996 [Solanum commersonii]|uniref:Uncharacterized protein n=1 Tax=Solanum commersonii TaxID=4109 RepID=A0A9J6A5Y5_SOLCO|nr:hypothetical protein H5410_004996 [Solanum commersonii]
MYQLHEIHCDTLYPSGQKLSKYITHTNLLDFVTRISIIEKDLLADEIIMIIHFHLRNKNINVVVKFNIVSRKYGFFLEVIIDLYRDRCELIDIQC